MVHLNIFSFIWHNIKKKVDLDRRLNREIGSAINNNDVDDKTNAATATRVLLL